MQFLFCHSIQGERTQKQHPRPWRKRGNTHNHWEERTPRQHLQPLGERTRTSSRLYPRHSTFAVLRPNKLGGGTTKRRRETFTFTGGFNIPGPAPLDCIKHQRASEHLRSADHLGRVFSLQLPAVVPDPDGNADFASLPKTTSRQESVQTPSSVSSREVFELDVRVGRPKHFISATSCTQGVRPHIYAVALDLCALGPIGDKKIWGDVKPQCSTGTTHDLQGLIALGQPPLINSFPAMEDL